LRRPYLLNHIRELEEYQDSKNYLLVGGCSFTDTMVCDKSWANYTAEGLDIGLINTAMSGTGNESIFNTVLNHLHRMIEMGYPTDSIIVGVMWTDSSRLDLWRNEDSFYGRSIVKKEDGHKHGKWVTWAGGYKHGGPMNKRNKDFIRIGDILYADIYTEPFLYMRNTLKNILLLQEFLKRNNIKYFFDKYTYRALGLTHPDWRHPEIRTLLELIDFDKFISDGEYEWCFNNTDLPFLEEKDGQERNIYTAMHPTSEQHKLYAEKVVIPYITKASLANKL
tara:strand:- start:2113 stop:2949 length:837 start_codon:yes stop_codon:yes gene_type:complete